MQLLLVKIWNCPQVYVIFDTWPILPRYVSSPVPSTCSIRRHIRVSTSNRARCNINRLHESIGSLGSLCRSLYRRTHVALRCTTRSTDPLVRLWPRKENYVHAYLPRAAETHISFYHLPFLFLFLFFFFGSMVLLLVDFGFHATIRDTLVCQKRGMSYGETWKSQRSRKQSAATRKDTRQEFFSFY